MLAKELSGASFVICKTRFPYFGNQLPEMQTHSTEMCGASFDNTQLPKHGYETASFVLLFKILGHLVDVHVAILQVCAIP